jgi:hypothetical protein
LKGEKIKELERDQSSEREKHVRELGEQMDIVKNNL